MSYYTYYLYDFSNRLIKEEEIYADGIKLSKSYEYDYKGNRVRETDIYGNETHLAYDPFNRLIKRILPSIPDAAGKLISPVEKFTYNELNHPVTKQDAQKFVTTLSTNAYGKPTFIKHPDGSCEKIIYNLDGSVKEATDALGTKTYFEYDYQNRKIREEKISSDGVLLSVKQWIYNAFHLLHEIDPAGVEATFRYDGAGRLIYQGKGNSETHLVYDSLGRQVEKRDLYEEGKFRVTTVCYDILDRPIEESLESNFGDVFKKKQYAYDCDGNKTHETIITCSGPSTTATYYNSQGQPTKVTAPDGSETTIIYRYDFRDSWNQPVSFQQVFDPKGNLQTIIGNTHGQMALEERMNIFGETVQKTTFSYDACGHLVRKCEDVIVSKEKLRSHITAFEYDPGGKEICIIEAFGEPCQKITRKEYSFGEICKIIKPNGVHIAHEYDALRRLVRLQSSDGSILDTFSYDANHNIVQATNCFQQTTERTYDAQGNILTEVLGNGLKLEYAYDRMGRLKELMLPDATYISYGYNAGSLREVIRGGAVHRYHYDLSGKISIMELMHGCGEVHTCYDACLRPVEISSPHSKIQRTYDLCGNLVEGLQSDPQEEVSFRYTYDDLQQLASETGTETHKYQFDSLGNRVKKDGGAYENNFLNQLVSQNGTSYAYDLSGNLIRKTTPEKTLAFKYDALDRLIEVSEEHQKTIYQYDPFHRRLSKTSYIGQNGHWIESSRERYLYQGDKEIGSVGNSGTIEQLRVMGIGYKGEIGAAVLMEIAGKSYVPLHDDRGNITMVLDRNTKQPIETYRYTAFGEENVPEQPISPWRYSSKRIDPETGWVYFGRLDGLFLDF